jgi:hypothetical protein
MTLLETGQVNQQEVHDLNRKFLFC